MPAGSTLDPSFFLKNKVLDKRPRLLGMAANDELPMSNNTNTGGWRESSEVRSTGCFCRERDLGFEYSHVAHSQPSVTLILGDLLPFSDSCGHHACTCIHAGPKNLIHIK